MKKSIFTMLFVALAVALNAQQIQVIKSQAPAYQKYADNTLVFGYCGDMTNIVGYGVECKIRAAIEITPEVATKFQGAQISQLQIGIGNAPGSEAKIFITRSLDSSEMLYTQDVNFKMNMWNEITLDTPYTISEESFFVGYEMLAPEKKYPIAVDDNKACAQGDWCAMYDETSGKWIWEHIGESGYGNICLRLVLGGDKLPQYDLALENIQISEYVGTGKAFSIEGTVKNEGVQDVQSFEITHQIGNADPVATTFNAAVASGSSATFIIPDIIIAEDGEYEVKVEVKSINGDADTYTNNNSYTQTIKSLSNLATRKILIEEFSTTSCGNCPRAHTMMKNITADRDDIALVVHHAGFGTDNFTIAASRSYTAFYDENTYAPAMMIDRRNLSGIGALGYSGPAPGPVFGVTSQEDVMKYVNYSLNQPALISVNVEDAYNEETRELTVRVWGESAIELPSTPFLNIFITESGMEGYQSGGGNNYVHNHAIRANLTSTWGDALTIENGKYDVTYTYEISEKWKPENMSVIAFVANFDNKNVNNCVVYNTNWKEFSYDAAVNDITRSDLNVWAANGNIYISGDYKQAEVYATDGRLVKVANGVRNISVDATGIYLVRIDGVTYKVAIR